LVDAAAVDVDVAKEVALENILVGEAFVRARAL
jgi:hypothetical protein